MFFASFSILLVLIVFSKNAHAYLDPGTGSMIIQIVAGSILAITYTLKVYWKKIKGLFQRKSD